MIVVDVEQGTPEWLAARAGVITASRFKEACSRLAKGGFTSVASKYADEVALERVTGEPTDPGFVTWQMKQGQEREPLARATYERKSGMWVEQSGICLTDDKRFGYSSDGFVGNDGLIEIKCPSSAEVIVSMWRDDDLSSYMHQIQGGLWLTGRKWLDFVMYVPSLAPVGKDLYLRRIARDEAFIEQMETQLMEFMARVDENEKALRAEAKEAA